jgi:PAS domain S-box-containing protein
MEERSVDFWGTLSPTRQLQLNFKSAIEESDRQNLRNAMEFLPMPGELEHSTGYLVAGRTLVAIALRPQPSTEGGYNFAGRFLKPNSWGFLEGLFSATIAFYPFDRTRVDATDNLQMARLLTVGEVVIDTKSNNQILGYSLINGLTGNPVGYISISMARPLRQEGLHAIQIFLTGICLAGGALVMVVWFLLDRTILARIKDLTLKLDREKQSGRLPVRLNFRGEDELGMLARSIEGLALLLQNTQLLYRSVLEDQTELICRFDADFRLTFANAVFLRTFSSEEKSLQGKPLKEFLPEDTWKTLFAQFQELRPDKPLAGFTHEVRLSGQGPLWFRSTLRRNAETEEITPGGQWVSSEITAQIGAQRKMIESERRFRRLFESASDGLLLIDGASTVITEINSSLCRMLMITGLEVMGRKLDEVDLLAPCGDTIRYFRRSVTAGFFRNECRLERTDGANLYVELRCERYDLDGAEIIQISFRNVSERVLGEQELRRLSAKLLRLQDDERRRIARELHDSTAQNLSALEMNMSLLEPLVQTENERALQIIEETRQIAGECSRELRNISYLLHPPLIDEVGLSFAVKWFVDGFTKRTAIQAEVDIDPHFPRLTPDLEMPLFRVVQEAMTNIYRHSGANRAWVRLAQEGRLIVVEIRDNGHGFRSIPGQDDREEEDKLLGVGLAGMKERLAAIGGRLVIESSPQGVTISIRMPYTEETQKPPVAQAERPPAIPAFLPPVSP